MSDSLWDSPAALMSALRLSTDSVLMSTALPALGSCASLHRVFVINRRIVNTAIGRDVSQALEKYELPVLSTAVCQRVAFAETAVKGLLVCEVDKDRIAVEEIQGLTEDILEAMA